MRFCGLDVGTSGIKAVIFDEKGVQYSTSFRAYDLALKSDGTRTLDAADIWEKAKAVLGEAGRQADYGIDALAVSSFGEAFVCIDEADREISEVMIYTDRRGEKEYFEAMERSSDLEIAKICGLPPSTTYSISKMLHIQHNLPAVYEKTRKMLLIEDYINYKLTGQAIGDYSVASRTMLFDVHARAWSEILLKKFGIEREKLSDVMATGTMIGTVLRSVAQEIGLPKGVQVIAGGHDQPMAAVGAGIRQKSTVCSMGTSECMTPVFDGALAPEVTLASSMSSEPMWEKNKFCSLAYNATSGLCIKWFFDTFASEFEKTPYALFEQNMPQAPTRLFVQPYLMGTGTPYNDHRARFAIVGSDAGTTKYDLYKAIMEGLELDMRLNFELLRQHGIVIESVVAVGGGAASRPWMQIKADVMQTPVSILKCKEAGALGCAVTCGYALGCYASMEEAGLAMSHVEETIEPKRENRAFYDEKYGLYQQLHGDLQKYCAFATE
jgi:xylulokinase